MIPAVVMLKVSAHPPLWAHIKPQLNIKRIMNSEGVINFFKFKKMSKPKTKIEAYLKKLKYGRNPREKKTKQTIILAVFERSNEGN